MRTLSGGSLPEARSLSGRYADLVIQKADGTKIAIQVGRATKKTRKPIARERRAIKDLRDSGEFDHIFFLEYK